MDDFEAMYSDSEPEPIVINPYDKIMAESGNIKSLDKQRIIKIASENIIEPESVKNVLYNFNGEIISLLTDDILKYILIHNTESAIILYIFKNIIRKDTKMEDTLKRLIKKKYDFIGEFDKFKDLYKTQPLLINFDAPKNFTLKNITYISDNFSNIDFNIKLLNKYNPEEIDSFIDVIKEMPELLNICLYDPDLRMTRDILLYIKDTSKNKINFINEMVPNNIGIEIEGCINHTLEESLEHFKLISDISINCPDWSNYLQREYILKGFITFDKIDDLTNDINNINQYLNNPFGACKDSCGIHFHISNENILINLYGLLFLVNLIILWLNQYQDFFIKTFPYQLRLYGSAYSKKNNTDQLPYIKIKKEQILSLIKNRKFDDVSTIYKLYFEINKFNNKDHFLNVYPSEYKYIHIEFRGLATVKEFLNMCAIREYLEAINDMYAEVIKVCQADLCQNDERKYLKYKFKYLKLKNNIMNYNE